MSLVKSFSLYYNTIKHLKPIQIYSRLALAPKVRIRRALNPILRILYEPKKTDRASIRVGGLNQFNSVVEHHFEKNGAAKGKAYALVQNKFCFLNKELSFNEQITWRDKTLPKLWLYNLHYFDYAVDLAVAYASCFNVTYVEKLKHIVSTWIQENPLAIGDGWESYPLALRIVNWIKSAAILNRCSPHLLNQDPEFFSSFLRSLYEQVLFLEGNLEYHLLGNHLIKDAKALVFAGFFFEGEKASAWTKKGLDILTEELNEQILKDGGHFERSPMYHALVLEDYLDCWALTKAFGSKLDQDTLWREKITRMTEFLERISHPDRQISLFNDSAFGIAPEPTQLITRGKSMLNHKLDASMFEASSRYSIPLKDSGYYVIESRNHRHKMIIDCGFVGPDYLPGHAHCDTLSYELSLYGNRVIVDTGVYEYNIGPLRTYSRSTRAHNTITIDGAEQSEIWGSFRVGQRAKPLEAKLDQFGEFAHFEGSHDGFLKLGARHIRHVYFLDEAVWTIIDDVVGSGEHLVEGFVHLHPDVEIVGSVTENENSFEVKCRVRSGERFTIRFLRPCSLAVEDGLYFPEFGEKLPNKVLRYSIEAELPVRLGYLILL